jgi:PKD repeat protein
LVTVPNFPSNFFQTSFTTENPCAGDTTFFNINYHFITNVSWNFGDPASGAANTSTLVNAFHVYDTPGAYTVTLIAQNGAVSDTVVKTIYVKETPSVDLGSDVAFCSTPPDSIKLRAGTKKGQYLWSDGSNDSTLWVSTSGTYNVTFTNECGSDSDTILVEAALPLSVQLPLDTSLCDDSYEIIPVIQNETALTQFLWSEGDTTRNFTALRDTSIEQTQTHQLKVTNACGSASASMAVTFLAIPDGVLPGDSLYCLDDAFYLLNRQRWHNL